jgi:hypothetical protein
MLIMMAGRAVYRPGGLKLGGFLAALCGAWFVMGPVAWPVLEHSRVFVGASPIHELAYWIGYSLGPGTLLAALGAFVLGRPAPEPTVLPAERPRTTVTPTPAPGS